MTLEMRVDEPSPQSRLSRVRRSNGGGAATRSTGYDDALFEQLRALRRRLADEAGVPAFVVFGDATLKGLAAAKPTNPQEMLAVSGVGPAKLERYGEAFLTVIRQHGGGLPQDNGGTFHPDDNQTESIRNDRPLGSTHSLTHQLLLQGLTIAEIAEERGLSRGTVMGHIERIAKAGKAVNLGHLLPIQERRESIEAAFRKTGYDRLASAKELLGDDYSYDEIRLVRLAYDLKISRGE